MEILIYGLVNSLKLILIAFGFTLVYGISRLPNFAHGAIFVFTGFIAWIMIHTLGLPYIPAALLSLLSAALVGVIIYQFILKRIRGMNMNEIIATYAIGVALIETFRWLGFKGTSFTLPVLVEGMTFIGDVPIDYQRIMVVVIGIAMLVMTWAFTKFTKTGLALRGIAQDERAAMMLGIDSDMTGTIAMALGSAMSGLAALVLFPLGSIVVEAGYNTLIFALAVCMVGGIGSWSGTIIASFVLGFAQIITVTYFATHFQMVVTLAAIILTLIIKPSGIFGKHKELEERV
ncbi:MAG: branched-chain amino acid ABC transporter permease [Deltaproteobacteria bacterium]|nr:branched-chain amino acid ABC transporter permease [Candidatus Anaeroferrophillus wilburensis]MBN2888511.1 branched-chain amino acid ABC transporter permease [Deltaproteobacteria bacterium]